MPGKAFKIDLGGGTEKGVSAVREFNIILHDSGLDVYEQLRLLREGDLYLGFKALKKVGLEYFYLAFKGVVIKVVLCCVSMEPGKGFYCCAQCDFDEYLKGQGEV